MPGKRAGIRANEARRRERFVEPLPDFGKMPVGSAVEVARIPHGEPVPDGFRANPPAKTRAHHDRYSVPALRKVSR